MNAIKQKNVAFISVRNNQIEEKEQCITLEVGNCIPLPSTSGRITRILRLDGLHHHLQVIISNSVPLLQILLHYYIANNMDCQAIPQQPFCWSSTDSNSFVSGRNAKYLELRA